MEYEVEMRGVARGSIVVEAGDEEEAIIKANEQGLELADIHEVSDCEALGAEEV